MHAFKPILSTSPSWSCNNRRSKATAALPPTFKNANVTCTPAGIKVKRMSAIISLPLIPVLTTGFPREKIFGQRGTFHERECMKSMSGCFSALGGWLARHHEKSHAVVYQLMLYHVTLRVAAEAPLGYGTEGQQLRDLTWTEIWTRLWYFPPTLYQQKEDRDLKQKALVV